ncbi:hypothetical protein CLAFUW4_09502 [Fulvia fulva]|uniref:Uncharacterized protein n=1 Tax=Passalora fulva TaxID=5499 RepID=A0A9Q8UTD1_PASFU|nr:uncharacterized protein CLAFUR5_09599 [Fulvia fulva]KAK4613897.1 hypothetical protein CLAFUR4_09508 [Fulvia fulva]KAK4614886.1 hypothetical protein CLAFUR0_09499 [Fulvia fulva]UJO21672.1 hypothetical protein CLAFUR5_09599 [Fulvia fulva]WPV20725.1 hypothetical protein CLAFUW4_09502 [Fulvia fulva]WPV34770.1 hypothetical protein CLAFUW7_09503 [Fulvia fulva]
MAKEPREEHSEEGTASQLARKAEHNPQASLIGIPGELRNRIYRYALHENHDIQITATDDTEPGLLQTCRQVQGEACSIFRAETRFSLNVVDCRPEVPTNFHLHWMSMVKSIGWLYSGRSHWRNLKEWMRRFYEGHIAGEVDMNEMHSHRDLRAVQLASRIVRASRERPWADVDDMLETFKESVKVGDAHFWVDDH